jgi:hypothetical protein
MLPVWIPDPIWQNFSSLFREATSALEAKTGMERAHHLTTALYAGLSSIEAFLNAKMRSHMSSKTEEGINDVLRKAEFKTKIKKWPSEILGAAYNIRSKTVDQLLLLHEIRGHLIHPKTDGHDIYSRLETTEPSVVMESVAEVIARFHEAEGTVFLYWLFGWNYLNPRTDSHDIMIINNQQFCWSLQGLGFKTDAGSGGDRFQQEYMASFDGYLEVSRALSSIERCQPKTIFPYMPILCRRWWTLEHQRTCGNVTKQAIDTAMRHGAKPKR